MHVYVFLLLGPYILYGWYIGTYQTLDLRLLGTTRALVFVLCFVYSNACDCMICIYL